MMIINCRQLLLNRLTSHGTFHFLTDGARAERLISTATVAGTITTAAGTVDYEDDGYSGDNGPATAAHLPNVNGVAVDAAGNIYIADTTNNRIRLVTKSSGNITTVAGTGYAGFLGDDGPAVAANLNDPTGIALDAAGNIYFADSVNNRIRMISKTDSKITTVAGNGNKGFSGDNGLAVNAQLYTPYGVAVDTAGNIYIADSLNHRVRMVTKSDSKITTLAGNGDTGYSGDKGLAAAAVLNYPVGVGLDSAGNIYIADTNNNRIRMISKSDGNLLITTVAGTGSNGNTGDGDLATSATLNGPKGVAFDKLGNMFIADTNNNKIRMVTKSDSKITTVAGIAVGGFSGDMGPATLAALRYPIGVAVGLNGNIFIADTGNGLVRMVTSITITSAPTFAPTSAPTFKPTSAPTFAPTSAPTFKPTSAPTFAPTPMPTTAPTFTPTNLPASVCMMPPPPKKCTNLRKSTPLPKCNMQNA